MPGGRNSGAVYNLYKVPVSYRAFFPTVFKSIPSSFSVSAFLISVFCYFIGGSLRAYKGAVSAAFENKYALITASNVCLIGYAYCR